jgi:integrase
MKECIYSAESPYVRKTIKMLLDLMFDYAVEYEMTDKNYARLFKLDKDTLTEASKVKNEHVAFSDSEITTLWRNINVPYVEAILVQTYMGWRPRELCNLEIANINLEKRFIVGGMKTDYGSDRVVPIHSAIFEIVDRRVEYAQTHNQKYLFDCPDSQSKRLDYGKYLERFHNAIDTIGLDSSHRPHDPRKTFVTMCKSYGVNEYAIKRMVGHSIADITERVYTERSVEWLHSEVEKIKTPTHLSEKSEI